MRCLFDGLLATPLDLMPGPNFQGGMTDPAIKGPASYFPSIEKKYGQPISHWQALVRGGYPARHMDLVSMLKSQHGLGHGHANAIVAFTLAEDRT